MSEKINHTNTKNIVCPYCGEEIEDSWELDGDSSDVDCAECGKEFFYERNIDINYTSLKMEETWNFRRQKNAG